MNILSEALQYLNPLDVLSACQSDRQMLAFCDTKIVRSDEFARRWVLGIVNPSEKIAISQGIENTARSIRHLIEGNTRSVRPGKESLSVWNYSLLLARAIKRKHAELTFLVDAVVADQGLLYSPTHWGLYTDLFKTMVEGEPADGVLRDYLRAIQYSTASQLRCNELASLNFSVGKNVNLQAHIQKGGVSQFCREALGAVSLFHQPEQRITWREAESACFVLVSSVGYDEQLGNGYGGGKDNGVRPSKRSRFETDDEDVDDEPMDRYSDSDSDGSGDSGSGAGYYHDGDREELAVQAQHIGISAFDLGNNRILYLGSSLDRFFLGERQEGHGTWGANLRESTFRRRRWAARTDPTYLLEQFARNYRGRFPYFNTKATNWSSPASPIYFRSISALVFLKHSVEIWVALIPVPEDYDNLEQSEELEACADTLLLRFPNKK